MSLHLSEMEDMVTVTRLIKTTTERQEERCQVMVG